MIVSLVGCGTAAESPASSPNAGSSAAPSVAVAPRSATPATSEPTPTPRPTLTAAEEASRACEVVALIQDALELVDNFEENGFSTLGLLSADEWERWKRRMDDAGQRITAQIPTADESARKWTIIWDEALATVRHFSSLVRTWDRASTIDFPNDDLVAMVDAYMSLRDESARRGLDCTALAADIPTFGIEPAKARAETTAPQLRRLVTAMLDALDGGDQTAISQAGANIEDWAATELSWAEDKGDGCYANEYRSAVDSVAQSARRLADPESIAPELRADILEFTATGLHAMALTIEGLGGGFLDPCSS